MYERASVLLDDALDFAKASKWEEVNQSIKKVYSLLPKDPSILIR